MDIEEDDNLAGQTWTEPRERGLEGAPDEVDARLRAAHDAKLRPKRLEIARRNSRWHEIEEADLVPRGRGWLVSATSDFVFQPASGVGLCTSHDRRGGRPGRALVLR